MRKGTLGVCQVDDGGKGWGGVVKWMIKEKVGDVFVKRMIKEKVGGGTFTWS